MVLNSRRPDIDDAVLLWRWANDAETRRHAFDHSPIPYDVHIGWLQDRLASSATLWWIFTDADGPVGQVRFDLQGDVADIDITVAPERRGQGCGRAMLSQALELLRDERRGEIRPRASVLSGNARSLAMFRACGFVPTGTERPKGEEAIVLEPSTPDPFSTR